MLALASNHYLTGGQIDRGSVWLTRWFRWLDQAHAPKLTVDGLARPCTERFRTLPLCGTMVEPGTYTKFRCLDFALAVSKQPA